MSLRHPDLKAIIHGLETRGWTIAFAESCTGGRLSADLTTVPGSSKVVSGSAVCYQITAKHRVLGLTFVDDDNVVSERTADAMAHSVRLLYGADIGVATTGYLDGDHPEAYWTIYAPHLKDGPVSMTRHLVFPATSPRDNNREIVIRNVMEGLTIFAK